MLHFGGLVYTLSSKAQNQIRVVTEPTENQPRINPGYLQDNPPRFPRIEKYQAILLAVTNRRHVRLRFFDFMLSSSPSLDAILNPLWGPAHAGAARQQLRSSSGTHICGSPNHRQSPMFHWPPAYLEVNPNRKDLPKMYICRWQIRNQCQKLFEN